MQKSTTAREKAQYNLSEFTKHILNTHIGWLFEQIIKHFWNKNIKNAKLWVFNDRKLQVFNNPISQVSKNTKLLRKHKFTKNAKS